MTPPDSPHPYRALADQYPVLSKVRQRRLVRLAQRGTPAQRRRAKRVLVLSNIGMVIYLAAQYNSWGAPLVDLIHEGVAGTLPAIESYDEERGAAFSTHAYWHIRKAVQLGAAQATGTRGLPKDWYREQNRLRRAAEILAREGHDQPSDRTLAQRLHWSPEKVERVRQQRIHDLSLDGKVPLPDQEGVWLARHELLDNHRPSPEEEMVASEEQEALRAAMDCLTPRERDLLEWLHGFRQCPAAETGEIPTLTQIAELLWGCSVSNVVRIRDEALGKLRKAMEER